MKKFLLVAFLFCTACGENSVSEEASADAAMPAYTEEVPAADAVSNYSDTDSEIELAEARRKASEAEILRIQAEEDAAGRKQYQRQCESIDNLQQEANAAWRSLQRDYPAISRGHRGCIIKSADKKGRDQCSAITCTAAAIACDGNPNCGCLDFGNRYDQITKLQRESIGMSLSDENQFCEFRVAPDDGDLWRY